MPFVSEAREKFELTALAGSQAPDSVWMEGRAFIMIRGLEL